MSQSTGFSARESSPAIRLSRAANPEKELLSDAEVELDEKPKTPKTPSLLAKIWIQVLRFEPFWAPLLYTAIAAYWRLHLIDRSGKVVWDEAHFGKFGSYYIKGEFYHDVHPPLGKMLIGLSEWLAGFDGDFEFRSGNKYPEGCNYVVMRVFNALFSTAVVPVAYWAAKQLDYQLITVHLIALMMALESTYICLGKFILLDSILLFFTATTFLTMVKIHKLKTQGKELTPEWYIWMFLTGLSIGCVCSVKWVGLFVTALVGLYTVHELLEKFFLNTELKFDWKKYSHHWLVRIVTLIIVPFIVYLVSFKIHFALLYKSGTGDASTSSLFQVHLENTKIKPSPRDIVYGSELTIRSHGKSPNLLHSHSQIYPGGSNQQQITGYGHSDGNNNWIVKYSRRSKKTLDPNTTNPVLDGDIIRLQHKFTKANLHSHSIAAHVSPQHYEVAGYGSEKVGDSKDDWIIEVVEQKRSSNASYANENTSIIHPLSTNFRLKHADLGCYLATTGLAYPAWGFKQSEVVCKESRNSKDKSTWWNVEDHIHKSLEVDEYYTPPRSGFWHDFILINFAMAATNNALVPDGDKFDALASKWWEWPTLHVGLRMCGWSYTDIRYFLMGNVFNTWTSTAASLGFILLTVWYILKFQRQMLDWNYSTFITFLMQGFYPFTGWVLHYLPFIVMGRVTYVHHYVPALFFALFVLGFMLEVSLKGRKWYISTPVYLACYVALIFTFWKYRGFHEGMTGNHNDFRHLKLLPTWRVVDGN
ncbi:Dolichyl-phosphate-mannose--protein mannosyltransferase 6 [Cyberlindnera fabianii]|uniref:Dolichyl-phosphate-mannose--protein mannosyltransferase n=1 Tax=Cyberlindnera fabianii TaxID=36022 RepID=A0A1V2LB77_CYBFA|nr:Dolichyl-phosphate-mannose--protein mannosyltransferase 6 [Cyberlindnera fabianii]